MTDANATPVATTEPAPPAANSDTQNTPVVENNRSRRARRNNNRGQSNQVQLSNPPTFIGDNEDIGCVLGLRHERFTKKVPFESFTEKVYNHVITNFKDGISLQPVLLYLKEPFEKFNIKKKPKDLPDEHTKADESIYNAKIKRYINLEDNLNDNLQKVYGLGWGQCSAGLKADVKGFDEYEEKSNDLDIIWLLKSLKKIVSGIDKKDNQHVTYHVTLAALYVMKQGVNESNDKYL